MTTNEKTGEKLLASMRKTKAAAAAGKPDSPQAEVKAPQKAKPRPQNKRKTVTKRSSDASRAGHGDTYQSGRRVWPD
ncbi:MAG: hypothetical protein P8Y64_08415 [Gammaproteobacteria bacterium]|jgi:hypothetical protein